MVAVASHQQGVEHHSPSFVFDLSKITARWFDDIIRAPHQKEILAR
jgi:hypothetical protein